MTESTLVMGLNGDGLGGVGERVRKTREGKPKSRNGCRTCKLRRVKCDETKPHCMRCTRFGQRCDGYLTKTPSKSSLQSTTIRMLAPRAINSSPQPPTSREHSSESPDSSFSPPKSPVIQSPEKMQAFQSFCEHLSQHLSTIDSREWSSFVLRLYEDSPSIRYSINALGSLAATPKHTHENSIGAQRHQYPHEEPRKSRCLLRGGFGAEVNDFRSTMTASLLFSCFEGFEGVRELPVERVCLGLSQLKDWLSNIYGSSDWKRPILESDMSQTDLEIARAFKSLEDQFMAHVNQKENDCLQECLSMGNAVLNAMPATFETVDEARTSLEVVIRRSMHWLRSSMCVRKYPPEGESAANGVLRSRTFDTDPQSESKLGILREYEKWDEAYRPLLKFARSKGSSEENFLKASLLRLHWLSGYLNMSTNNSPSSVVNDRHLKIELDELLSIAGLLLKSQNPWPRDNHDMEGTEEATKMELALDMEVIVPVMAVGWTCRHRTLRKQAIELLLKGGKDSAWDGVVFGKTMAWLAEVEEEGLEQGNEGDSVAFIPVNAAVRRIEVSSDRERRATVVGCLQPLRGRRPGEEIERKIEIFW